MQWGTWSRAMFETPTIDILVVLLAAVVGMSGDPTPREPVVRLVSRARERVAVERCSLAPADAPAAIVMPRGDAQTSPRLLLRAVCAPRRSVCAGPAFGQSRRTRVARTALQAHDGTTWGLPVRGGVQTLRSGLEHAVPASRVLTRSRSACQGLPWSDFQGLGQTRLLSDRARGHASQSCS